MAAGSDFELQHTVRVAEHTVGIAPDDPVPEEVVGLPSLMQRLGSGLLSCLDRRQWGERFVVDFDQGCAVLGVVPAVGSDHRHCFSDVADPVDGKRGILGTLPVSPDGVADGGLRPAYQVLPVQDRHHPWDRQRIRDIDRGDLGVGEGTPHESRVDHSRQFDVLDVAGPAHQETGVLDPPDPGSEQGGLPGVRHPVRPDGDLPLIRSAAALTDSTMNV